MTKTKTVEIRLKEASARYTKAKANVDGTAKTEAAYQKAKKQLAVTRQAYAETRHVPTRAGDGKVTLKAVAAKAKPGKKGN